MTNEQIEKFLQQKRLEQVPVRISFKTRKTLVGMFIKTADYAELKTKNFWRIVGEANIESYLKSKDMGLARIYSGSEIVRLAGAK
ncbi:MAG: short-chain dehydrogenase [Chitinophagaceae bacterium]